MNVIDRLLKRPLKIEKRLNKLYDTLQEINKVNKYNFKYTTAYSYDKIAIKIYRSNNLLYMSCYNKLDGFSFNEFLEHCSLFENKTIKKIFSMTINTKDKIVNVQSDITAEEIDNIIKDIEEHVNKEYYNLKPKADKLIAVNKYFMR